MSVYILLPGVKVRLSKRDARWSLGPEDHQGPHGGWRHRDLDRSQAGHVVQTTAAAPRKEVKSR